ncbi:MAG: HAD-IIB family hydrolase [Pseudomonadota bacterium]
MSPHWLIFTDLDGTLLDHDSYDFTPALPAIERLKLNGMPIIPVSSKTLAELEDLVIRLELDGPVIAENGTVIRLPGEQPINTTQDYRTIRTLLSELRKKHPEFSFTGFGDMTIDKVVQATGLLPDAAQLARQRLASEPILWQGSEDALVHFREVLQSTGLHTLQGGRFLHILGNMDKGRAVQRLVDWYRSRGWDNITSLALGDSGNDKDMLISVDIPVIIKKKDGTHLNLPQRDDVLITELAGPAGWNQAINNLLNEKGIQ